MRVVIFHPVPLPPRDYGGVERVVLWLARGLIERGHEVWIGAREGSRLPDGARLIEFTPPATRADDLLGRLPSSVDVVHFMAPPEIGVLERLPCPGVLTVHGNGKAGESFPRNTVFLSQDHARRHGADAFVWNGIDPADCRFEPRASRKSFFFLSKTSWSVKNLKGAISLALGAGARLRIAGGSRPFWARALAAIHPRLRWEGPVNGERKAELLGSARALIFPVLWPEPFGLVVAEALMSGAPVIASPRGSLPELVPPHVGALLEPERDRERWLELLRAEKLPWSPEACRAWAMERLHYARMAEAYESVYKRVIAGEQLNAAPPTGSGWVKG